MLRPRMLLQPAARYPADPRAVFILALSVFGGITAILVEAAPATLEDLLPRWGVITWGLILFLGSVLALLGLWLDSLNGIILEQIGSVMVGVACIFYSTLAVYILRADAIQVIGIVMAWGIACLIRWAQLQLLIRDAYRAKVVRDTLAVTDGIRQKAQDDG